MLGFKTQACCNYSFTHPQILSCLRSQLRKELWTDYRGFADVPPDLFERGVRNPTVAVLKEILNGLSWPNDKARIAPAATGSNDAAPLFRIDQTHLSCAKLVEICEPE